MEALLLVLILILLVLGSYVAYAVHGIVHEAKTLPSAKVTTALNERVSVILAGLSEEEWRSVASGDTSILAAKSAYTRTDSTVRDGLVRQLKEVEANLAKLTREYTSNAGNGYAGLAAVSRKGMEHLELKANQLRKEIKECG